MSFYFQKIYKIKKIVCKNNRFSAHRWLDENECDRQTEVELFPTEENKIRKCKTNQNKSITTLKKCVS